jgi:hypothetical protein
MHCLAPLPKGTQLMPFPDVWTPSPSAAKRSGSNVRAFFQFFSECIVSYKLGAITVPLGIKVPASSQSCVEILDTTVVAGPFRRKVYVYK